MNMEALLAEVRREIQVSDSRTSLTGEEKRERAVRVLTSQIARLLPQPWRTIVGALGAPALEALAHLLIHAVRKGDKALDAKDEEILALRGRIDELTAEIKANEAEAKASAKDLRAAQKSAEEAQAEVAKMTTRVGDLELALTDAKKRESAASKESAKK